MSVSVGDLYMASSGQNVGFEALKHIPKGAGGFTQGEIFKVFRLFELILSSPDIKAAKDRIKVIAEGKNIGPGDEHWPEVEAIFREKPDLKFEKIRLSFPDGLNLNHKIALTEFVEFEGFGKGDDP